MRLCALCAHHRAPDGIDGTWARAVTEDAILIVHVGCAMALLELRDALETSV